ncbi:MAG: hypothetical protein BWY66_02325 [bacterium ADurb.Bin374]|nr:MAG: hypothetical protein BWY66_02325 [bacterium ADurb.Bin374]
MGCIKGANLRRGENTDGYLCQAWNLVGREGGDILRFERGKKWGVESRDLLGRKPFYLRAGESLDVIGAECQNLIGRERPQLLCAEKCGLGG